MSYMNSSTSSWGYSSPQQQVANKVDHIADKIGFALDIVAMYVFKLTGGDAAALLGGTAVLLIIIINIMNFNKKCFEQTCDNIIEGFVFGINLSL